MKGISVAGPKAILVQSLPWLHESPAPSQSSQSRCLLTSSEEADRVGERTPGGQRRHLPARLRDPSCASPSRCGCASADSRGRDGSGSEGPFVMGH